MTTKAMRVYENNPPIHPKDRILLRSIGQLGKHNAQATAGAAAASWLRRTEYISAELSRSTFRGKAASVSKSLKLRATSQAKLSASKREDADPVRTLAAVLKGFDVANPSTAQALPDVSITDTTMDAAELSWKNLKHPNKSHLRIVDTFPLLPDMSATSDAGGYLVFQFATDPLVASKVRDTRMDVGLLKPHAENIDPDHQVDTAEHNFDFFLPANKTVAAKIKRKLAAYGTVDRNPLEEFRYNFVRAYETKTHKKHDPAVVTEAALTFHPGSNKKQKAAYYYPIVGRYVLQPRRAHKFPPGMPLQQVDLIREQQRVSQEGSGALDVLKVTVRELSRAEKRRREEHAAGSAGM